MAATYNRGSKGLGIGRLEVGPEFLSPAHDSLIHLSASDREHAAQGCASLEDDRLQARQRDVNLELVIGSLGQHGTHSGVEGDGVKKSESSPKAETFLASFAKEKKAVTYLLGRQGQRERLSSTPAPSSTLSYLAGFSSPGPDPEITTFISLFRGLNH